MESDVDKPNRLASKLFADLNAQRQNGYVLCKCEECDHSDAPVWECSNFCSRGTSSLHNKNQRIRKRHPRLAKAPTTSSLSGNLFRVVTVILLTVTHCVIATSNTVVHCTCTYRYAPDSASEAQHSTWYSPPPAPWTVRCGSMVTHW